MGLYATIYKLRDQNYILGEFFTRNSTTLLPICPSQPLNPSLSRPVYTKLDSPSSHHIAIVTCLLINYGRPSRAKCMVKFRMFPFQIIHYLPSVFLLAALPLNYLSFLISINFFFNIASMMEYYS